MDTSFSALLNDASKTLARQRDKGPRVCTVPAPPRKSRMTKEKRAQAKQAFASAVFHAMENNVDPGQIDDVIERFTNQQQNQEVTAHAAAAPTQAPKSRVRRKKEPSSRSRPIFRQL